MNIIGANLIDFEIGLSDVEISYATTAIEALKIPAGMQIGATLGFLGMEGKTSFHLTSDSMSLEIKFSGDAFKKVGHDMWHITINACVLYVCCIFINQEFAVFPDVWITWGRCLKFHQSCGYMNPT